MEKGRLFPSTSQIPSITSPLASQKPKAAITTGPSLGSRSTVAMDVTPAWPLWKTLLMATRNPKGQPTVWDVSKTWFFKENCKSFGINYLTDSTGKNSRTLKKIHQQYHLPTYRSLRPPTRPPETWPPKSQFSNGWCKKKVIRLRW